MKFKVDSDLELQVFQHHHAEPLFKQILLHRTTLRQWLPWVDSTTSVQDTLDFIDTTIAQFKDNKGFQAAVVVQGQVMGAIGFHPIDWNNLKCSMGYWLSDSCVGRGIITKSVRFLVGYAFEHYQLNRVEIRCGEANVRSRAIPERLGFKQEGISRESEKMSDGRFVDHVIYGMLAKEWR